MQTIKTEHPVRENDSPVTELNFVDLFQQYYPRVYNYLRYRMNSRDDTEDLISQVFERAYTRRDQFDPVKGSFSTWLFQIAHNSLANYYRTKERRAAWVSEGGLPDDLTSQDISPEARYVQQETISHLLQGLNRLNERDQEVISLKFAGRLSNKEIGTIMDLKEKTVSVVLLRAMQRLQKEVKEGSA